MPQINRAIISVSDKSGIVEFARELHELGIEILSTGGTAKALRDAKIPVIEISDYTGSPEILDGRLKTLHPKIHGGILGIRGDSKHKKEMKDNGIEPIDMVVVNLYPFEATIAKKDCKLEDAVENIDIGGPTMLRAAAKNWQDVAVVTDSADYQMIINELRATSDPLRRSSSEASERRATVSKETCFKLAQKVFALTARYEAAICNYLGKIVIPPFPPLEKGGQGGFPLTLALTFNKVQDLRYGENPHQHAAFYREAPSPLVPARRVCGGGDPPAGEAGGRGEGGACITSARQLHGKELSYNNIMDADAALELAKEFANKTAAVIIKHANPCGVAVLDRGSGVGGRGSAEVFIIARDCDPVSAFGGIVALTKPVDVDTAKAIGDTFFEVIIAPGFEEGALKILQAKKNLRLLEIPSLTPTLSPEGRWQGEGRLSIYHLRKITGGLLVQDIDNVSTDVRSCKVVTKRKPTEDEISALDFAWRVVKHVKSNAIVISAYEPRTPNPEHRILGIGAGQTSRVDSVKIAIMKMRVDVQTYRRADVTPTRLHASTPIRILASDAFFPFRDSIDMAAQAGITAIIEPGGSIRDEECIKAADEHNIAMIFTGVRHFRH